MCSWPSMAALAVCSGLLPCRPDTAGASPNGRPNRDARLTPIAGSKRMFRVRPTEGPGTWRGS